MNDDDVITANMEKSRLAFLDVAKSLAALSIPLEHIAAGAASVSAQLLGSIIGESDIDSVIEEMTRPMKIDARKSRAYVDASAPGAGETSSDFPLVWMSFSTDEAFLGVALVRCASQLGAIALTHRLGINPGGSVLASALPTDIAQHVATSEINRLLNEAEAIALKQRLEEIAGRTLN